MRSTEEKEAQRLWLNRLVESAQSNDWYGTITITFDRGVMKRVRKDESLLPPRKDVTRN